jgi:orotate phosphoribosyltransferase
MHFCLGQGDNDSIYNKQTFVMGLTMTTKSSESFIEFLVGQGVLKFGEFTLNSGRKSPYFFNLGSVDDGLGLLTLGRAYAESIIASEVQFDVLFGPAYKGIPIAVATALALAERNVHVGVAYNRKEAKDHGEGGNLVGAPVTGRILLVDDVLTSGKAVRQAVKLIKAEGANIAGVVIALDRAEYGPSGETAVDSVAADLGAPLISIAGVADVIHFIQGREDLQSTLRSMRDYQQTYCKLVE